MSAVVEPLDPREFAAAIESARLGDGRGIEQLFRQMQPSLLRYFRGRARDAADDLAAEVWLAVAKSIRTFEGDEHAFRAWMFSIARRRLADLRRTSIRRRTDVVENDAFALMPADDRPDQSVLDHLSGADAAQLVSHFLTEDQAEVLLLRVLGDLSAEQVAEVMGRSANWVRVTQHRALHRLAERLGTRIRVTP